MKTYENKWYKIFFYMKLYDGNEYSTFRFGFGDTQVKKLIKQYNAYKVTEWII